MAKQTTEKAKPAGPRTVALFAGIALLDQARLRFNERGMGQIAQMCDEQIDVLKTVIEEKGYEA